MMPVESLLGIHPVEMETEFCRPLSAFGGEGKCYAVFMSALVLTISKS